MIGERSGAATLEDRFVLEQGTVYLSGIQALVRLLVDQNRRDRATGLRIGTFVSGYPGSPLGTYDLAVQRLGPLLVKHDIVHVPAANEELAATAIMGTQMLDGFPHSQWDGVTAIWYGKGPGVDRSGDALKHGNFAGTSRHGAVVVLSGDDHEGKSSTMPFQDDYALMASGIPILYPASVAEFLTFGQHAVALSRFSGCWVALKLVASLCDGGETVDVDPTRPTTVIPRLEIDGKPFQKRTDFTFFPGKNTEHERHLYEERHQAVAAYARANHLDRIEVQGPEDRVGIIAVGKSWTDMRQAVLDLGLDDEALRAAGVRLMRQGLIYPADPVIIRDFACGLETVIVIEEKRGFLESQVKEALCGTDRAPRVIGKLDENDRPFFPVHGGFDADLIAERLGTRLRPLLNGGPHVQRRLDALERTRATVTGEHTRRTPNYCSGCPHNTSTVLLEGQVAWGSPGCHSFATLMEPKRQITAMTQYGGEGLPWVGLGPFTDRTHMVQNVGDGSLFHSSYLNIRFCAAVGANITFKILYNGAIANTGAQEVVGAHSVPALTRLLSEEGATKIAVVTKDPSAYRRDRLGARARVYPLDRYDDVMRELAATHGVTVMIYDESCANERRRRQKRGLLPTPNRFVVINEEICENCGDCGDVTNCMSLQKVETEFGPKTQIHASTCNQDYTCLKGDCPSFMTVETRPGTGYVRPTPPPLEPGDLPDPDHRPALDAPFRIYVPGVGGTGVLTLNALLAWAALLDGKRVLTYDQTGAAQKWGPVLSSIAIAGDGDALASNRVGVAQADLYLALDPLAAAAPVNLAKCDAERSALLLVTSIMPTGEMVRNPGFTHSPDAVYDEIRRRCRPDMAVAVDARRLAEGLFGDHMLTNIFALGVAWQAGMLPLSAVAIEQAIRLNGVQADANVLAFRYGRLWFCDAARVEALLPAARPEHGEVRRSALARLSRRQRDAYGHLLERCGVLDATTRDLVATRAAELIDYQGLREAVRYVNFVLQVADSERAAIGAAGEITEAAARYHFKLLAYKDEYEVARLHLKPELRTRTRALFSEPIRVRYQLHPPLLRTLGLRRKLALGPWFDPFLVLLRAARRLRGTPFDPFGYAAIRREERALPDWYERTLADALKHLNAECAPIVNEVARLPDAIRGYEDIKLRNAASARKRARELLDKLMSAPSMADASN